MTCRIELKPDALKFPIEICHHEEHQDSVDVFAVVEQFHCNDLKTMLFLLMTDLYDKESLRNYLHLAAKDEASMRFEFCKKWNEKKLSNRNMIELLGTMKKFKCLKSLGKCRHVFESEKNSYTTIPALSKFFFSLCEELIDDEVEVLRKDCCPEVSKDICGEELICVLLLHEKITPTNFSFLENSFLKLNRKDLIDSINSYDRKWNSQSDLFYHIRQPVYTKPSGLAVIINQKQFTGRDEETNECLEERIGSDADVENLIKLWSKFGFQIEHYENITEHEIQCVQQDLFGRDLESKYDVFVACIMSHGKKSCFYSSDCKTINIDSFISTISDQCMAGKPKLFFIQACQGSEHNEGIPVSPQLPISRNLATDSRAMKEVVPRFSDILKVVATIDGYVSYRDLRAGSLFVTHLVENIDKYGDEEDILSVSTMAINDITEENPLYNGVIYKQQAIMTTTLRKKLRLKRVHGQDV